MTTFRYLIAETINRCECEIVAKKDIANIELRIASLNSTESIYLAFEFYFEIPIPVAPCLLPFSPFALHSIFNFFAEQRMLNVSVPVLLLDRLTAYCSRPNNRKESNHV